jgi:hypothetical protein
MERCPRNAQGQVASGQFDLNAAPADGFERQTNGQHGQRKLSGPRGGLSVYKGSDPGRPKWKSRFEGETETADEEM